MSLCPVCGRVYCDHTSEERGQTYKEMIRLLSNEEQKVWETKEFLRHHQEYGAEIMANFLKKQNASIKLIEKVKSLIIRLSNNPTRGLIKLLNLYMRKR